jgi:SAM-dependent methyltransferase
MLTAVTGPADHVPRNRAAWDRWAAEYAAAGARHWAAAEPSWGIWSIPEAQAGVLPSDLNGLDSIELGCGTGYVSAWLGRRGARPAGLDNSAAQLATARTLQDQHGLRFPLVHASAEQAPFADASFDLAVSEYGASIWCDPYVWILEADRLLRPYFGMHRFEWPDDESVEFHLGHGDMIRLLRRCGLDVEDLLELRPGPDATTRHPVATVDWARQWPCEEVWKARKLR